MVEFRGVPFVDAVPEYRIKDSIMYIDFGEFGTFAMPLAAFRKGHARSARVMAEHDARRAEIVPIKRGKG